MPFPEPDPDPDHHPNPKRNPNPEPHAVLCPLFLSISPNPNKMGHIWPLSAAERETSASTLPAIRRRKTKGTQESLAHSKVYQGRGLFETFRRVGNEQRLALRRTK
eukprot:EG_transcript_22135